MEVATSTRVYARNGFGQFRRACDEAATATIAEAVNDGADLAADMAPYRTGVLANSITPRMIDSRSGEWGSDLKYALPQETGSVPHPLPANVTFFWVREGRDWKPSGPTSTQVINHPGNPATNFLRDSYEAISARIMSIARKHYPG